MSGFRVGNKVRLNQNARPKYLIGEVATVVGYGNKNIKIEFDNTVGRFSGGLHISCPSYLLEHVGGDSRRCEAAHHVVAAPTRTCYSAGTPMWVRELAEQVKVDNNVFLKTFKWGAYYRGGVMQSASRGTAWKVRGHVIVRYGTDSKSHRLMILHEMAHLIAPENAHHSIEFWVIAWKLFRKYGAVDTQEDLMYVYLHEVRYMKTARKGFEKVFWDKSTVR